MNDGSSGNSATLSFVYAVAATIVFIVVASYLYFRYRAACERVGSC